ncbi:ABC transporter ATP-binding protein [Alkalibacillus silvisoli]|uniref:ABC transporter ATP-binding protein n=1 Tax=Alkalibacillus silvisoli TaxID=392823 RepID=A0ABP3K428_9BACI
MLELQNINYVKKNKEILNKITAGVERGESICLFGPNGAGKSTLLKIMASLIKPTSGKCEISLSTPKTVGYIPQQIALFPNMSVKDHLKYYQKLTKQKDQAFINEMSSALDLNSIMNKKVEELSGGMARKLNLAVGVIHRPEMIFLDEAFVGVDLAFKHDMLTWLNKLNNQGVTIVFVSHDWHVIYNLAKTMWVLQDGKLMDQFLIKDISKREMDYQSEDSALKKMFALRKFDYEKNGN